MTIRKHFPLPIIMSAALFAAVAMIAGNTGFDSENSTTQHLLGSKNKSLLETSAVCFISTNDTITDYNYKIRLNSDTYDLCTVKFVN